MAGERSTSTPIDRVLAEQLVGAYKGGRLTQADLVERTSLRAATVQRLLAGESAFKIAQLLELAEAIGDKPASAYLAEAESRLRG